jgi:hypothetical protein
MPYLARADALLMWGEKYKNVKKREESPEDGESQP